MNGIHDMGGMHGMGSIQYEKNEPVFHARWEGRVFALRRAMAAWGKWNIDATRHEVELVPAAEYLRMSYYERQFAAFIELLVKSGLITRAEVESGKLAQGSFKAVPPLTIDKAAALVANGIPASRDVPAIPRFQVGQRVRARNMHPAGHTRLPRYTRGKLGTIDRDHASSPTATPIHLVRSRVYSVRFAARELWGEQDSPHDGVYVDMWDDYLEPA